MWLSRSRGVRCLGAVLFVAGAFGVVGCAESKESASRDTLTADVGKYPPPPAGAPRPRVGVPPFSVQAQGSFGSGKDVDSLAADQMSTLLEESERFRVIERTQLDKLLKEQNMEGIVRPGEMAKPGQVRGVDYLLIGKVTNLRVKNEKKERGFGLANVGGMFGAADIKKKDVVITTECGVDIRFVDPTTGEVWVANFSEYKRSDTAGAMGVQILGANATSDADIQISEDDKGKILRLALDDAFKKMLPKIDKKLKSGDVKSAGDAGSSSLGSSGGAMMNTPAAGAPMSAPSGGGEQPVAAKRFCSECGKEVPPGTKFCPHCGHKME